MKYLKILLVCLALMPISVLAATTSYETKNLEQVLKEEGIEADLSGYKETDDQITIYLFRGNGCGFCKNFLTFLSSIVPEYGKYFKLESYEVWYNKNNNKLLKEVSEFIGQDAEGVPFIIIGDQVFPGYASQYDDAIKQTILSLYNSSERYDVLTELAKAKEEAAKASKVDLEAITEAVTDAVEETNKTDLTPVIVSGLIFAAVGSGAVMFFINGKNNELNQKLEVLEKKIVQSENKINDLKKELSESKDSKKVEKSKVSKGDTKNTKKAKK